MGVNGKDRREREGNQAVSQSIGQLPPGLRTPHFPTLEIKDHCRFAMLEPLRNGQLEDTLAVLELLRHPPNVVLEPCHLSS